ncbi:MAG: archaemetzincin family Zn-dependent metalloprotease [Planctomycetota bacterium]|nr:archaemetzincin family Zn-dependent metalloprotease [Planctomycetota bacterium]
MDDRPTASVAGLGSAAGWILDCSRETISSLLCVSVSVLPARPEPAYAYIAQRGQYDASAILENIAQGAPDDRAKVVAVTELDLCTPVLAFVFGAAQMNGSAAVVSLARLRQEFYRLPRNDRLLRDRLAKELTHELGHMFGLTHCRQVTCVMHRSDRIALIDAKSSAFCARCSELWTESASKWTG